MFVCSFWSTKFFGNFWWFTIRKIPLPCICMELMMFSGCTQLTIYLCFSFTFKDGWLKFCIEQLLFLMAHCIWKCTGLRGVNITSPKIYLLLPSIRGECKKFMLRLGRVHKSPRECYLPQKPKPRIRKTMKKKLFNRKDDWMLIIPETGRD